MITTTVKELKTTLPVLGKVVGRKHWFDILTYVRMQADPENNLITFTASDLCTWERVSIKADVTTPIDCLLGFKFLKVALAYARGKATFTWEEENKYLNFKTGNMEMVFLVEDSDNFPRERKSV